MSSISFSFCFSFDNTDMTDVGLEIDVHCVCVCACFFCIYLTNNNKGFFFGIGNQKYFGYRLRKK